MNCPNDRYVNDAAICSAVAAMLARIGVKVNLMTETKAHLLPEDPVAQHVVLLLGWTPSAATTRTTRCIR